MSYTVKRCSSPPALDGHTGASPWDKAEMLSLESFHPQSSDHRPRTQVKVLYDADNIYLSFQVEDRYVRCVFTEFQASVCSDSCVEFFVQPGTREYLNFECNCGGNMLLYCIADAADQDGSKVELDEKTWKTMDIFHSLPERIDEEIQDPVSWVVQYRIPFTLFEKHPGITRPEPGTVWKANFYKCADQTSHPHWASWKSVGEKLSFHKPECFGEIIFG